MRLKILVPSQVLMDEPVEKIVAEAENGAFCLLPRHIDFVAALLPGVLVLTGTDGVERYVAIDRGVLVKCGADVFVSVMDAVAGAELAALEATVAERYLELDEAEHKARAALARLEAGTLRRFMTLEEQTHA